MQQMLYRDTPEIVLWYPNSFEAWRADRWTGFVRWPEPDGRGVLGEHVLRAVRVRRSRRRPSRPRKRPDRVDVALAGRGDRGRRSSRPARAPPTASTRTTPEEERDGGRRYVMQEAPAGVLHPHLRPGASTSSCSGSCRAIPSGCSRSRRASSSRPAAQAAVERTTSVWTCRCRPSSCTTSGDTLAGSFGTVVHLSRAVGDGRVPAVPLADVAAGRDRHGPDDRHRALPRDPRRLGAGEQARHRHRWAVSLLFYSMPDFWLAMMLLDPLLDGAGLVPVGRLLDAQRRPHRHRARRRRPRTTCSCRCSR